MRKIKERMKVTKIDRLLYAFSQDHNIDEYAMALGVMAFIQDSKDRKVIQTLKTLLDKWEFSYSNRPIGYRDLDGSSQMIYDYLDEIKDKITEETMRKIKESQAYIKEVTGVVLDFDIDEGANETDLFISVVKQGKQSYHSTDMRIRIPTVDVDVRRNGVYRFYNLNLKDDRYELLYGIAQNDFEYLGQAEETMNGLNVNKYIENSEKENKIMRKAEKKEEGFVITIEEAVRIPDTDIILEKGEEIRVYPAKVEEAEDKDKKKDDKEKIDKIKAKVEKGTDLTDEEQKILDDAKKADKEKEKD